MTADYASRIQGFLPDSEYLEDFAGRDVSLRLQRSFRRSIIWFNLLYDSGASVDASVLIASAHSKVIEIWILIPLGLLHSSYTSLRTIVDICTSYTFYRSHPIEWMSVCEGNAPWIMRGQVNDWHLTYTAKFREMNKVFGLKERLDKDYHELSNFAHGIPLAGLPTLAGIERTEISESALEAFVKLSERVDYNLNLLFLSIAHREISSLSREDFRSIVADIPRPKLREVGFNLPRP